MPSKDDKSHKYYDEFKTLRAGELVIYRNPDTQKRTWYVRIKLNKDKGYVRRSLKTVIENDAVRRAWEEYKIVREKEFFGVTVKRQSLDVVVEALLKTKKTLSPSRRNQYEGWCRRYILPYFKGIFLDELHDKQGFINEYPNWRMDYWDKYDEEVAAGTRTDERELVSKVGYRGLNRLGKRRPFPWRRNKPARDTVLAEIRMFNGIMAFALDHRWIKSPISMDYSNLPQTKPRRAAIYTFEDEEISKLRQYFRNQTRANKKYLFDDDGQPLLDNNGDPKYILFPTAHHTQRRAWINLRVSFFLQLNTGMRVSEINNVKWSQIQQEVAIDDDGNELPYIAIKVEETKSERRSKIFRMVYCPVHLTRMLNEAREVNAPYNEDSHYVFSNSKGKRFTVLNRRFQQLLQKLDLYESDIGTTRDRGHIRSYWMSKALKTKPIHIVAAAAGTGIQTCYDFYAKLAVSKRAFSLLDDIKRPDSIANLIGRDDLE